MMAPRTARADGNVRRGRLAKAEQFADAAATVRALADEADDTDDAYVTLCVHAGIAAGGAICAARLGVHAQGESHEDAISLLATVDKMASRHLKTLLDQKTRAGYSHQHVSRQGAVRAERAMNGLLDIARAI